MSKELKIAEKTLENVMRINTEGKTGQELYREVMKNLAIYDIILDIKIKRSNL